MDYSDLEFDNNSTEFVICPYCGEKHETDEAYFFDENFTDYQCYNCGKKFAVKTTVIWSWETAPLEGSE